MKAQLYVGTQY